MTAALQDGNPFAAKRVLVVGAGGIGCELLKNLVLSGFLDIEVVDLDTIELSNLNRQFLFRRRHIGKFKAEVAAEAVMSMNPEAKVVAHVGNIMDTEKFPFSFFKSFDIVLNALDNINARRYVNGVCQGMGLPLVESGTAGYLGQCTVIIPRRSECYDCTVKEPPKTFAVCTIRSTPSAPIHCVVWAKDYLLPNLFGEPQEDASGEIVDGEHLESLRKETEAFRVLREMAKNGQDGLGRAVFEKIFHDDIEVIRGIESLWEGREPPKSIEFDSLAIPDSSQLTALDDQQVWTIEQWTSLMMDSIRRLCSRAYQANNFVPISFDKDDQDTLDFVASVANLRAQVYGISLNSRFALKAIAGNIIPAIATTNAIAAGMIVVQSRNILGGMYGNLCDCFITFDPTRKDFFIRSGLCAPNPNCTTCFVHRCRLNCNPKSFTIENVVDLVIPQFQKQLGSAGVECLSLLEGSRMIWDADDMPQTASKTLSELNAGDSKFIRCEMLDGLPLVIAVMADPDCSEDEYVCTFDLLPQDQVELGTKRAHPEADDDDDDDLEVIAASDDSDLEILS